MKLSYEFDIRCYMYGNKFSPKKIEKLTGLKLEKKIEVGDLVSKGYFKKEPSVIGCASLVHNINQDELSEDSLINFVKLLSQNIDILRANGVQHFDLSVGIFYQGQCNLSFSPYLLTLLSKLGLDINLSCYDVKKQIQTNKLNCLYVNL